MVVDSGNGRGGKERTYYQHDEALQSSDGGADSPPSLLPEARFQHSRSSINAAGHGYTGESLPLGEDWGNSIPGGRGLVAWDTAHDG